MSLSMDGHIDNDFDSAMTVQFVSVTVTEEDGIFTKVPGNATTYIVNVQPMSMKEISFLGIGLERINDYRKLYVNSGDLSALGDMSGYFTINGEKYKPVQWDIRLSRDYCKMIVAKEDE